MAVTAIEIKYLGHSTRGTPINSAQFEFFVLGGADEVEVLAAMSSGGHLATPKVFGSASLPLRSEEVEVKPVHVECPTDVRNIWNVTVPYGSVIARGSTTGADAPAGDAELYPKWTWEYGQKTVKVKQSNKTLKAEFDAPVLPADVGPKAINKDEKGVARGVDVPFGSLVWTETHLIPKAALDGAFILAMHAAVGKVNLNARGPFAPGELKALPPQIAGYTIDNTGKPKRPDVEVAFRWEVSPDATLTLKKVVPVNTGVVTTDYVGADLKENALTGTVSDITFQKDGWEYLEPIYYSPHKTGVEEIDNVPTHYHLHQVFETVNNSSDIELFPVS